MIVYVYGSLKAGYGLHYIIQYCDYLGKAITIVDYTLLDGPHYPFLIERKADEGAWGELYAINDTILDALDRVEGHPNFYERKVINVKSLDGTELEVYAYIHPDNEYVSKYNEIYEWNK